MWCEWWRVLLNFIRFVLPGVSTHLITWGNMDKILSSTATILRSVAGPVKPVLSRDHAEARTRVRNLYRTWYRQIPFVYQKYLFPFSIREMNEKLKEKFRENQHITDLRVIDMLIIKGHFDLHEVAQNWQQKPHIARHFNREISLPKSNDFMSKFLAGKTSD